MMKLAAEPKEDAPVNPVQSEVPLCDYELKHYCVNCDEVVCIYCTIKEHNDHYHDMLNKWQDEGDAQTSNQVRKIKCNLQDNCGKPLVVTAVSVHPANWLENQCFVVKNMCMPYLVFRDCTMSNPVVISDPVKLDLPSQTKQSV